jgi:hypothetical protein
MTTALQSDILAEINAICSMTERSLKTLVRWSDQPQGPNTPKIRGRAFSTSDQAMFTRLIKEYRRTLMRVARAADGAERKQSAIARRLILRSFAAHVCGVLRSFANKHRYASPEKIVALAIQGKGGGVITDERVRSEWVPKTSESFRLVTKDGPRRTAQRIVVRDMLAILGTDSEFDYSRRGKGEKALLTGVCTAIEDGYHYWWTPDVKDCFPSLKPGHFGHLPLTRHEIRNILFTPKCARVVVRMPGAGSALYPWLGQKYHDGFIGPLMVLLTMKLTRQGGLQQGAVHAPLLARGFLGRELRNAFGGEEGITSLSSADDLAIGARLKKDAQAAKAALTERLKSHPAGSVLLHKVAIRHDEMKMVQVLGYFLEPGNGYHDSIHVKPAPKRFDRFRRRLAQRLAAASPNEDEFEIGENYWKHWYASQQAWTKIPVHSEAVSLNAMYGCVTSFINGQPMKGNWVPATYSAKHYK